MTRAARTATRVRQSELRAAHEHPWLACPVIVKRDFPPVLDTSEVAYRVWRLDSEYSVPSHRAGLPDVTVPAGFHFDGASIPRALWWIDSPMGAALRAAVVHDWRYWTHAPDDRLFADDEFFWNLISSKRLQYARAQALYLGVRAGGWWAWNRRARQIREGIHLEKIKPLGAVQRRVAT